MIACETSPVYSGLFCWTIQSYHQEIPPKKMPSKNA